MPIKLENPHLRAEVDPSTGWLRSLVDKSTGRDLLQGVTGPHTVVTDDPTDTWGHRVVSYAGPGTPFAAQAVRLVEDGPVRSTVRVESTYAASTLVEELVLSADARHLEVRVTLDWHQRLKLLKLRFPTALRRPTATYEIPYGHLERPADGAEEPGQAWVDVTGELPDGSRAGLTVINDAKSAYDVSTSPSGGPDAATAEASDSAEGTGDIGITAVRSPVYAWHEPRALEADELGPASPYSFQDQGRQRFRYLLVPHAGDWRTAGVVRLAAELAQRPVAMYESFHAGTRPAAASFAAVSEGPVVPTVVKRAEEGAGHVVVRAYESAGATGTMRLDLPFLGRTVEADFRPHEIRTFLVPTAEGEPVVAANLLEDPHDRSVPHDGTHPNDGSHPHGRGDPHDGSHPHGRLHPDASPKPETTSTMTESDGKAS